MEQRAEQQGLKELIAAVEVALLEGHDAPGDRLSWLVQGLLRQTPERLWSLLRDARPEDRAEIADLEKLLAELGQRLVEAKRLEQAVEVLATASRWGLQLPGSAVRQVVQAQARSGATERAEETIRELLKRDAGDVDALRILYRLVRDAGRAPEAHEILNRLVELEPTAATATFAYRERKGLGAASGRGIRIALLSSYVIDPLTPFLDVECRRAGLAPDFYLAPFNQYTQEILNASGGLYAFDPDVVFLALDLEDLFPALRRMPSAPDLARARAEVLGTILTLVRELRVRSTALVVVHELPFLDWSPHGILDNRREDGLSAWTEELNRGLAAELAGQPHAFLLPLRQVLSRAGTERSQTRKLHYMARMRHDDAALRELARYSMRYVKPLKGLTRKCVVVDLDGTLWGGVVGEVGPEGIRLGPTAPGIEFVDFQEGLLNLMKRGILLAVCSKNNPDDVFPVLREHKHMVLREEHFSALRVNWRNKAENLVEIARELNIGLDALVFLDDNPVERELIRQMLPEVLTVDLPRDAARLRSTLDDLTDFELLAVTREDELRVTQYQANRQRQALERASGSLEGYLSSLEIQARIARAEVGQIPRLVQMFNKTNQFNTTTRRYQAPDVDRLVGSPAHRVYVLEVADRFGDHGLVGTAVVRDEPGGWCIDSLLLSCRVMGLSVETALLKQILDDARGGAVARLTGTFVPTAKNAPTADFYRRHGFELVGEADGVQTWSVDPPVAHIDRPSWIAVEVGGA